MIFMSQSGIIEPERQAEWDQWYVAHLRLMLSVNGIDSAQRFKLIQGENSPSLALYTIVSAEVFQGDYYQSIRGMGEWLPLIDRRHYRRNLFAGLDAAPPVANSDVLLIADRDQPESGLGGISWIWLEAVGLDRSPAYRGMTIASRDEADRAPSQDVTRYQPVTKRLITSP